jgi:CheY-like chemotaxis protein
MAKILYVEDHPGQRDLMAQMLQLSGFEVDVAEDGVQGVEKAKSWLPDLILMDLRMPRMDGFEAIEALKNDENTIHIPIIAISAWTSSDRKKQAFEAGANDYYTKPVDIPRLMATIRNHLAQKE